MAVEIIGRNLAPTPRIDGSVGSWVTWTGATAAQLRKAEPGAGLDGTTTDIVRATYGSYGISCLLPADEVWIDNAEYRVTMRYQSSSLPRVVAALSVDGFSTTYSTAQVGPAFGKTSTSTGTWFGNVHELTDLSGSWVTESFNLSCDPQSDLGITKQGTRLQFHVFMFPPVEEEAQYQPHVSHVRIDRADNTFGDQYFDGDGYAPTEPGATDPAVTFAWTGTAYDSSSTATAETSPPLTVTAPDPADWTQGRAITPVQLSAIPNEGLTWTASGLPDGVSSDESGLVTGTPTTGGTGGTATVTATDGTQSDSADWAWSVAEPSTDPWDLLDALAASLAPRVAAMVGRAGDPDTIELAKTHLPIVVEYVRGYTRGRGFDTTTDLPAGPLRIVIVSATARLTTNPEQVTNYTMGDYSERPAVLSGWTLPELAVLRRYRRISA